MRTMKNDPGETEVPVLGDVSLVDVAVAAGCPTPEYLLDMAAKTGVKVTVLETWDGFPAVSREDARRLRLAVSAHLVSHLERNQQYNAYLAEQRRKASAERVAAAEKARAESAERNRKMAEEARRQEAARAAQIASEAEGRRQYRDGQPVPFDKFDPSKVA